MKAPTRVQRKMKRRRNFFKFLLFISLLSIGITFVLNAEIFEIGDIVIEGNSKISKDVIINSSRIYSGENIFRINLKNIKKNLSYLPYVKDAELKRKLPSTINIEVVEREGVSLVKNLSMFLLIDIEGNILEELDNIEYELPIIIGLEIEDFRLGNNIFLNLDTNKVNNLVLELNNIELLGKVYEIDLNSLDNVNIKLNNGISVAFGTLNNVKYRLSLLNEVLKDIEEKNISCSQILMNRGEHPIIITDNLEGG